MVGSIASVGVAEGLCAGAFVAAAGMLFLVSLLRPTLNSRRLVLACLLYAYFESVRSTMPTDPVVITLERVQVVSFVALLLLWLGGGGKRLDFIGKRLTISCIGLLCITLVPSTSLVQISPAADWILLCLKLVAGVCLATAAGWETRRLFIERGGEHLGLVQEVIENLHVKEVREGLLAMLLDDVRTPLTGIKGSAQALLQEPEMNGAVRDELLKIIESETNSLASLFQELSVAMRSELAGTQGLPAQAVLERIRNSMEKRRESDNAGV